MNVPFLWIPPESIVSDPALDRSNHEARGARKVFVTELYEKTERHADNPTWDPNEGDKVPVVVMPNFEIALFTEQTVQDHHYHGVSMEIYEVVAGTMRMRVDGQVYAFPEGSTVVIRPGTWHEVLRDTVFTAKVFAVNCGGIADKFTE